MKAAVTVVLACKTTVHNDPLLELHPLHPPNVDVPVAVAVRFNVVPAVKAYVQDVGVEQLTPGPVTLPVPAPENATVRTGAAPTGVHPRLAGPFTVIDA